MSPLLDVDETPVLTVLEVSSPLGPLALVERDGQLAALSLDATAPQGAVRGSTPLLERAARQLAEYFDGRRERFELPLAPRGTAFQQAVWRALLDIPFGKTQSYGDVARAIGRPKAVRAVGAANGQNPIALIIPCHRVIGQSGQLVGYGGGLPKKKWLLAHETRQQELTL